MTKKNVSLLCRNCTRVEMCLKEKSSKVLFMAYTTYCTRFDNRDKEPSLFPFLQPYEQDCENAEYIYNQNKKYGKERENSRR